MPDGNTLYWSELISSKACLREASETEGQEGVPEPFEVVHWALLGDVSRDDLFAV